MASGSYISLADENLVVATWFLKFDNMTSNAQLYTGFEQIFCCDNISDQSSFTTTFAANNIVKAASVAGFQGSLTFPCRSLLSSTGVLDDYMRNNICNHRLFFCSFADCNHNYTIITNMIRVNLFSLFLQSTIYLSGPSLEKKLWLHYIVL